MNKEQMWEELENRAIATTEEIQLVTNIMGYNEEALESILYSRTALNSFEQLLEEDDLDY